MQLINDKRLIINIKQFVDKLLLENKEYNIT